MLALGGAGPAIAVGALVLAGAASAPATGEDAAPAPRGSAVLDGRTFTARAGPVGEPADVDDTLVFDDGLFLSEECERRCDYPASPYFAREREGVVEFLSETRCPGKDAELVWRGTVDGEKIRGEVTWTSSRWYWTFERTFRFEGVLADEAASIPSG